MFPRGGTYSSSNFFNPSVNIVSYYFKESYMNSDGRDVVYDDRRWRLLRSLRLKCLSLMEVLWNRNIDAIVHGSMARGDVSARSDVDVFIPSMMQPYMIELALRDGGIEVQKRYIVQATPFYAVKGCIEIDDRTTVSFPLSKFTDTELDFYRFGGSLTLEALKKDLRVPGVSKKLMLVEPTAEGHVETHVVGRESFVAKRLNVGLAIVKERVRTLLRRKKIGRTGVFIKRDLMKDEDFGSALRNLIREKPPLRRRVNYVSP